MNAIHFHPSSDLILSAGKDRMVYFHDFSSIGTGKPSRHIRESHNVRTLSIHPSGRFILVGTDHWTGRASCCLANRSRLLPLTLTPPPLLPHLLS